MNHCEDRTGIALVVLVLFGGVGCANEPGPRLLAVEPAAAARNATVTLTGSHLCGADNNCEVVGGEITIGLDFPTTRASIIAYDDTSAQIVIPPATPIGATELVVTVNDRSSNALPFDVLP